MLYVFSLYGAKIQQICQKTKNLRLFVLYIIYYILNMYAYKVYFSLNFAIASDFAESAMAMYGFIAA